MQTGKCRACGASIVWIRTPRGKYMPCDEGDKDMRLDPDGSTKLVTIKGEVITGELVGSRDEGNAWGFTPHWQTCRSPQKFRKRGRA